MKKNIFLLIASVSVVIMALSVASVAFAQDGATAPQRTEEYCMVLATSNLLGTKVSITVDHGQEVKLFKNTGAVRDDEGKLKKFNTVIDALNYMNEDGWKFVNAYVVTVNSQSVYHYMMKRDVMSK